MESIWVYPKINPSHWIEYLRQSTLQVSKSTKVNVNPCSDIIKTSNMQIQDGIRLFYVWIIYISKFLIQISILYYHKKKKTTRKIDSAFCHTTFALIVLLPWLNILIKVAFHWITEHVFLNSMPMKYSDANQSIMLILIWFFIYILLKILKKNCWL